MLAPRDCRAHRNAVGERDAAALQCLKLAAAGIGSAAQDECALAGVFKKRRERVEAEVGIERNRVRLIALECLARIHCRGRADVAALGVQNHRNAGVMLFDVGDALRELLFGADCGIVRDLRLERACPGRGGIDDLAVERKQRHAALLQRRRQSPGIGVEADAQQ